MEKDELIERAYQDQLKFIGWLNEALQAIKNWENT
jgi:hypothetical protein